MGSAGVVEGIEGVAYICTRRSAVAQPLAQNSRCAFCSLQWQLLKLYPDDREFSLCRACMGTAYVRVAAQSLGAEGDVAFSYSEWYPKNVIYLCWVSGESLLLLVPSDYLCNVTKSTAAGYLTLP